MFLRKDVFLYIISLPATRIRPLAAEKSTPSGSHDEEGHRTDRASGRDGGRSLGARGRDRVPVLPIRLLLRARCGLRPPAGGRHGLRT